MKELTQAQSLALFHICQEALANSAKHAKAKNVRISLWTTEDRALLEINDDGKGFDVEKMSTFIGHGLANMQTRARSSGGDVDITSIQGEGTTVLAWVPRGIKQWNAQNIHDDKLNRRILSLIRFESWMLFMNIY